jgi:hypothetical protein
MAGQTPNSRKVPITKTDILGKETDGNFRVIASGTHTWAGGAATSDHIPVPGVLATDLVLATLTLRNATQYLVLAAKDPNNDRVTVTLSANGQNDTCKIDYLVLRF